MFSILFVFYAMICGAYRIFGRAISVSIFADGSFDEGSFGWSFATLTSLLMLHIITTSFSVMEEVQHSKNYLMSFIIIINKLNI